MNTIKKMVKNTGVMLLANALSPVFSFLIVIFVARFLGVSGLGKFSLVLSIFIIFQTISNLGFAHLITREVSKDKSKASKYLINSFLISLIFTTFTVGVMCLVGYLLNYSDDTTCSIYIISFALIPASLSSICQSICRAFEKYEYVSFSLIGGNLVKAVFGLLVLFNDYGLVELIVVILVSHLVSFLLSLYTAFKCIGTTSYKVDLRVLKWIVKTAPTFALIFIFSTIYWNIDIIMLSKMKGSTEVGFYSAATKLMSAWMIVPITYVTTLQPLLSVFFMSSYEKFRITCEKSIKYLMVVTIPIAMGTTILAKDLLCLFYKDEFLASTDVLCVLIWTLVPFSAVLVFAHTLIASNNQKIDLRVNVISMVCNVGLNLLLIPKLSYLGAGIATLISVCIFLSLQYNFIAKHLFTINFIEVAGKSIISATLMGIGMLVLRQAYLPILIFVAVLVYSILLLSLKTFSQSDIQLVLRLWEKEKI